MFRSIHLKLTTPLVYYICLAVSLVIFFQATIPSFFKPMITSEDGYARLASGQTQYLHLPQARDYIWPPLTKIVYSLPFFVSQSYPYLAARILSYILIAGAIVMTALLTWRLTRDFGLSVLALALAAVNPVFIVLSTQTLSENIWIFLVGLSLFFLLSRDKNQWNYGYFFWALSQSCRYESWYLTPVIIFIFWTYHRRRAPLSVFILSSLVFPVYWLLSTYLFTGNWHYYLDEKLTQAAHGSPLIYRHLLKSFAVWAEKLHHTFSSVAIAIFIVSIPVFLKKKNYLFILPVFLFFSLVFQVYTATMEIFPLRYLSLLPLTVIPLLLYFIHSWSCEHYLKLLFVSCLFALSLSSLSRKVFINRDYVSPSLMEVGALVAKSASPCYGYIKAQNSYQNGLSALWYFSQKPVNANYLITARDPFKFNFPLKSYCYTVVLEKPQDFAPDKISLPPFFGDPILDNAEFRVYEPPFIKREFQNYGRK